MITIDWLSTIIAGIIILAIGFIVNRVFSNATIKKIGYAIIIIGAAIILIGIILLVVMLVQIAI